MISLNNRDLCENCFQPIIGNAACCPHCGYSAAALSKRQPLALPMSTILMGKYIVGKVLGMGGFGITYLAYDAIADRKVAIKEYYPSALASRYPGGTGLLVLPGEKGQDFKKGAAKFYEEAELISHFNGNPNIINVYEFFYQNDTAYYVMEYLDGSDLAGYLKKEGKPLSAGKLLYLLDKLTEALMIVHSTNTLHRDITPDNIFVTSSGAIKLIDFGAARHYMTQESQNFSVILKEGFAPIEQYQKSGRQGPWTDIYALGATSYYLLTGKKPLSVFDRLQRDTVDFSSVHPDLAKLLRSMMAIPIEKRPQNMFALKASLQKIRIARIPLVQGNGQAPQPRITPTPVPIPTPKPQPQPVPQPVPQPTPQPAPQPVPQPSQPSQPSPGQPPVAPQPPVHPPLEPQQPINSQTITQPLPDSKLPQDNEPPQPKSEPPTEPKQEPKQEPKTEPNPDPKAENAESKSEPIEPLSNPTVKVPKEQPPSDDVKKKRKKRKFWIPAAIIASVLFTILLPIVVLYADGSLDYTLVNNSYYVSGRGFCTDDYIVIPETYNGKPVIGITESAFTGDKKVKVVTMSDSVKHVEDNAFRGCTNIIRVNMSENLETIGNYAFCETRITEIVIPETVKSIGKHAFYKCTRLTSVEYLAKNCSADWYDAKAKISYDIFKECPISSVVIGKNVRYIPTMLFHNSSKTFEFPAINIPASVYEIHANAFKNCQKLATVSFESGIRVIETGAFYDCTGLKIVKYTGSHTQWNNINIYPNNSRLTSAAIQFTGGQTTQSSGKNPNEAEQNSTSVTVSPEAETTVAPEETYPAPEETTPAPEETTATSVYAFSFYQLNNGTYSIVAYHGNYEYVIIPSAYSGKEVTNISAGTFWGDSYIKSVIIPDGITTIATCAFEDCPNLSSVTLGNNTIEICSRAFYDCPELTSIVIPISVQSIDSAAFPYLTCLYYEGTQSDWNVVTRYSDSFASNTVIYYYSEYKPTTSGNYWHYANGVPTKW